MNKRTVSKILLKKHKDFIASIKDLEVRALVDKHSMITGGAIASALLNEKINDYDYYFTNVTTVKAVAQYYVREFIKAHPEKSVHPEVQICGKGDEPRVKVLVQSKGFATEKDDKSPYEYFESKPQDENAPADTDDNAEQNKSYTPVKERYRPIFMTSNAITLSDGVQLILRFYGEPEKIHENYDFIHCTNYWTPKGGGSIHLNQAALESLLSKNLYYVGSKYPVCSVIRTRKFIKRGWHINAGQYIKMLFQVSELDLTDIKVLEDQLTGVDNAYFYQVIEYFKERIEKDKDFNITGPYLCRIIDRIF